MRIATRNLSKAIARHPVLNGIDLELRENGVNVIIGPNGAGKTTLLRILGLLETPDSGEVLLDGIDCTTLSAVGRLAQRRRIGFVFQHPLLLAGTVRRNLTFARRVRRRSTNADEIEAMLQWVGLAGMAERQAATLSGGEKQRLQLARVLFFSPPLLLLDEPTASIDPQSRRGIEEAINGLASSGMTIVLTTHDLLQARRLGQKFFFLKAGRLVQQGTASDVFSRPLSLEIAEFASADNMISGTLASRDSQRFLLAGGVQIRVASTLPDGPVTGVLRAEDILLSREPIQSSARNSFRATVLRLENSGIVLSVTLRCGELALTALLLPESAEIMGLAAGQEVYATFKSTAIHILAEGGPDPAPA